MRLEQKIGFRLIRLFPHIFIFHLLFLKSDYTLQFFQKWDDLLPDTENHSDFPYLIDTIIPKYQDSGKMSMNNNNNK